MLFVTHDLGVVAELCNDVSVIYAGQTREIRAGRGAARPPAASLYTGAVGLPSGTRHRLRRHPRRGALAAAAPPGCRFAPRCASARAACTGRAPAPRQPERAAASTASWREGQGMTPILEVEDLTVALGGASAGSAGPCRRCRRCAASALPSQRARCSASSGIRLRQDHARPHHPRPAARKRRAHPAGRRPVSGLAPQPARRARNAVHYVHQDAGASLDPWWSIGQALEEALIVQGVHDRAERRARSRRCWTRSGSMLRGTSLPA